VPSFRTGRPVSSGGLLAAELQQLSAGTVTAISPDGPVIGGERRLRGLRAATFVPALNSADRRVVAPLSLGWVACLAFFWTWWLEPGHRAGDFGLIANSAVLAYVSCFPAFFIGAVNRLRIVNPDIPLPLVRVAFVVTRAPSEPWAVAERTLTAMLAQDFPNPYDVWLCDELPTPEITAWCSDHSVGLSTRAGSCVTRAAATPAVADATTAAPAARERSRS
jgi:cellulose synthase (UDP-forming)